jgi:hypothetical protein
LAQIVSRKLLFLLASVAALAITAGEVKIAATREYTESSTAGSGTLDATAGAEQAAGEKTPESKDQAKPYVEAEY